MAGPLDDLLPIRRILKDGKPTSFATDLDIRNGTITVANGVATVDVRDATAGAPSVALSDASHSVALADARRARYALLSAARTHTLLTTGAVIGDAHVVERADAGSKTLFIDAGSGEKIRAVAPGSYGLRHDGTRFRFDSYIRPGDEIRYLTDFHNDDGTRVIADGVTPCATGVQRAFDLAQAEGFKIVGSVGTIVLESQIKVYGGVGNSYGVMFDGSLGGTLGASGCCFLYTGADLNSEAVIKLVGASGSIFRNFSVHCNGKAARGVWNSIENASSKNDESAGRNLIQRVAVTGCKDVSGAFHFGYGPETGSITSGSSDVPFAVFDQCFALGTGVMATNVAGFSARQGNNTKDATFKDCIAEYCAVGLDVSHNTGTVTWGGGASFFGVNALDVNHGGGALVIDGTNTEASRKAIVSSAASDPSQVTIRGWVWNGECNDDGIVAQFDGMANLSDSAFWNSRLDNAITSFGSNAIVTNALLGRDLVVGMRVRLQKLGGTSAFPAELSEDQDYFIQAISHTGLTGARIPTISLSKTSGGSAMTFGTGSIVSVGDLYISAVTQVQMQDPNNSGVHTGNAVNIDRCHFNGAADTLHVYGSNLANPPLNDPYSPAAAAPNLTITDCFGGRIGKVKRLRDFRGRLRTHQEVTTRVLDKFAGSGPVPLIPVSVGVPGMADVYLIDFAWLAREFPGETSYEGYIQAPSLAFASGPTQPVEMAVEWCVAEVITAFAGVATLTLKIGDFDTGAGSLLGGAGGVDLKTTGKKGRTAAELGTDFTTAANVVMGAHYCGATNLLRYDIAAASAWSNLTGGKAYLRIKHRFAAP